MLKTGKSLRQLLDTERVMNGWQVTRIAVMGVLVGTVLTIAYMLVQAVL